MSRGLPFTVLYLVNTSRQEPYVHMEYTYNSAISSSQSPSAYGSLASLYIVDRHSTSVNLDRYRSCITFSLSVYDITTLEQTGRAQVAVGYLRRRWPLLNNFMSACFTRHARHIGFVGAFMARWQ